MRNATLSVLWLLLLGTGAWASTATAQTDQTEASGDTSATDEPSAADGPSAPGASADSTGDNASAPDAAPASEQSAPAGEQSAPAGEQSAPAGEQPAPPAEQPAPPAEQPAPTDAGSAGTTAPAGGAASQLDESVLEEGDLSESAPAGDDASTAADEESAGPPPLPWRNSFFGWTNQVSANTFYPAGQLSYQPLYMQSFYFIPRWYITDSGWISLYLNANVQLTNLSGGSQDAGTAYNRDPLLWDFYVSYNQPIPWEGFVFLPSVSIRLPMSKASQVAQNYLGLSAGLSIFRTFDILGSQLTLIAGASYTGFISGSNVTQVGAPQPDLCSGGTGPQNAAGAAGFTPGAVPLGANASSIMCDQLGGYSATNQYAVGSVSFLETIGEFSFGASFAIFAMQGAPLAAANIPVETSAQPLVIPDNSRTHWRDSTSFGAFIGYQFLPWLQVQLGIQNARYNAPAYNPNGSIRNPIINPDTQFQLSFNMQLDEMYTEIVGTGEDLTPEERQRRRQGLASRQRSGGTF